MDAMRSGLELPTNSKMVSAGAFRRLFIGYTLKYFTTMAKVKYYTKENTKLGTHRWYAVPVPNLNKTCNLANDEYFFPQ